MHKRKAQGRKIEVAVSQGGILLIFFSCPGSTDVECDHRKAFSFYSSV